MLLFDKSWQFVIFLTINLPNNELWCRRKHNYNGRKHNSIYNNLPLHLYHLDERASNYAGGPMYYIANCLYHDTTKTWWRYQMETFSALLAVCAGNSPVPGEFPTQRPVTRSFNVFFNVRRNKRSSKQSWGWWSETPLRSLWRHCYGREPIGLFGFVRIS